MKFRSLKGPWVVVYTASEGLMAWVRTELGREVALVGAENVDEANAIASLIAAAPELRDALKDARKRIQAERDGIIETHCKLVKVSGTSEIFPDTNTIDEAGRDAVAVIDAQLAQIDAALTKAEFWS